MKSFFLPIICCLIFINTISSQCFTDRHNTTWSDAWISCEPTENPNALRGISHWIRYQLGDEYSLGQVQFWNYNEPNKTDRGLQEIVIDYTTNGVDWEEWGHFTLLESNGSSFYEGDLGPDLEGLIATGLLITAITNHGGDCYALSEIKIEVKEISSNEDLLVEDFEVLIIPNPADDQFKFTIENENQTKLSIVLSDINGRVIQRDVKEIFGGKFTQIVNTSQLINGDYFLELKMGNKKAAKKISVFHQ